MAQATLELTEHQMDGDEPAEQLLLKIRVVHQKVDENVLYRTLECDPNMLTKDLIVNLKNRLKDSPPQSRSSRSSSNDPTTITTSSTPQRPSKASDVASDVEWGMFYPFAGTSQEGMHRESVLAPASTHITSNSVRTASLEPYSSEGSCGSSRGGESRSPRVKKMHRRGTDEDDQKGMWLDNEASLQSHGLPQMAVLEFRNAMRLFTITDLEDNLSKTMRVSNIGSVKHLLEEVSVRFSITNLDLYALQVIRDGVDHYWLNPEKRLSDQLMSADERMVLRQRYFADADLESTDPYALHFMYLECREGVTKGDHPISMKQALTFAALQMQIAYRDYDPLIHVAGFLSIDVYLPLVYRTPPHSENIEEDMYKGLLEEDIYAEHRKLKGLNETEAKRRYCKILTKFPTYGVNMVSAKEKTKNSRHFDHKILIGIRFDSVLCLHPVSKEVFSTYALDAMDDVSRQAWRICWTFRNGDTPRDFELTGSNAASLFVDLFHAYSRLSCGGSKGSNVSLMSGALSSGGIVSRKSGDAIAQQLAQGLNLRSDESKSAT